MPPVTAKIQSLLGSQLSYLLGSLGMQDLPDMKLPISTETERSSYANI